MTARAREGHQRTQPFHERRPDSPDLAQPLHGAEGTAGIPSGDDAIGKGRPDAWKRFDLGGGGAIEVDRCHDGGSLGVCGLTSRGGGFVSCVTNRVYAPDLPFERRRLRCRGAGRPRAPKADSATGERDESEEPERFALICRWHALT